MTVGDAFEEIRNVSEVLVGEDLFQRGLCSALHVCLIGVIWAFQKSRTILAHAFPFDQNWKLLGSSQLKLIVPCLVDRKAKANAGILAGVEAAQPC